MSSLRRLERDRTVAELASVEKLLREMTQEDVITRLGLEDRREELQQRIAELVDLRDQTASAALFFGGRPVVGSRGIESEFGGQAVAKFQDLVAKLLVREVGELGQRGPVPNKAAAYRRDHPRNVDRSITQEELVQFNLTMVNVDANARVRVRRVRKDEAVVREGFTLLSLVPAFVAPAQVEQRF